MNSLYLLINLAAFSVPFIFTFHSKIQFYKKWREAFFALSITASIFILWDIIFTSLGVWGFNERYILSAYLFNLPIEEVLFFFCIPYSCLFTYHALKKLVFNKTYPMVNEYLIYFLFAVCLIISIFNYERLYTFFTFLFLGICFFISRKFLRTNLYFFFMQYLILVVPMFIVNGILTGTGIDQEVVWYNNTENTGVRLLTIPIEDFFYGMIFILLNSFLFETFCISRHGSDTLASY